MTFQVGLIDAYYDSVEIVIITAKETIVMPCFVFLFGRYG